MTLNFSERYVVGVNFLLIAALAYFAALAANDVVARMLTSAGAPAAAPAAFAPAPAASHSLDYYKIIAERDVFNATRQAAAPAPVVAQNLNVRLLGTSLLTIGNPFAIIEDQRNSQQSLYSLGEDIPDVGKLVAIEKSRVIIERNGQRVALEIPANQLASMDSSNETASSPPAADSDEAPANPTGEAVRHINGNQFQVDRATVDAQLANLAQLFTQVRATPNLQGGKSNGFTLSEIASGSIFQQMGLQNGDMVTSVGGQEISDPSKAMEMMTLLRSRRSIAIALQRSGRPITLNYEIR